MAVETQGSKAINPKRLSWSKLLIVGFMLVLSIYFLVIAKRWGNGGFTPAGNSLREQGAGQENTVQLSWPEKRSIFNLSFTNREPHEHVSPAVSFRIPKEYLDAGGTYLDKNKEIEELSIGFELPGAGPFQNHPELNLDRNSSEYARFKEKWFGRFFLRLRRDGFYNPERVMSDFTNRTSSGYFSGDGHLAGLIRYSSQTCLSENGVDHPDTVKFVAGKESDDYSRAGCRINRRSMELISKPGADINDFVAVSCIGTSCHLNFDIMGRAAIVSVRPADLTSWKVIASSARALVHGFIVPGNISQVEGSPVDSQ